MTKKQTLLIMLVIISAFIVFMKLGFRKSLFKHSGALLIIAGSLPNFVSVLFFSVIFSIVYDGQKNFSSFLMVAMAVIAMIAYEMLQPFLPGRIFDLYDIAATVLGGVFIYPLLAPVNRFNQSL